MEESSLSIGRVKHEWVKSGGLAYTQGDKSLKFMLDTDTLDFSSSQYRYAGWWWKHRDDNYQHCMSVYKSARHFSSCNDDQVKLHTNKVQKSKHHI